MNKRKEILKKKSKSHQDEIEVDTIEKYISEEIADKELEKLGNILGTLDNNSDGTNYTNVWKQLRKAYPKNVKPLPTGVENTKGKVITNSTEKEAVILEHFEHRMRKREIKDEVKDINALNNELFKMRLKETKKVKSPPFEMIELNNVLKTLKSGKSKDPNNYICELFKEGVIGSDLKISVLMMMNQIKRQMCVPICLRTAHITILQRKG